MYIHIYVYTRICIYMHMAPCASHCHHTHARMHTYIYIYIYKCVHIDMCVRHLCAYTLLQCDQYGAAVEAHITPRDSHCQHTHGAVASVACCKGWGRCSLQSAGL